MNNKKLYKNKLASAIAVILMVPYIALAESEPVMDNIDTITVAGEVEAPEVIRLKNSPITSVVVGQAELNKVKFTDTTELLNRIPGVSKSRNLRIPRGDKGYTIPLVDGFSLRNPYRGSVSQIDDTNTNDIERIEIIKGTGSALYGSNAFGGVVNIITKEPPLEQENRVWVEAGDHDRLRAGASTAGTVTDTKIGNIGYFFDTSRWDIGGYRDDSDDDRTSFSGKLVFHPSNDSKLWVRAEHLDRYVKTPGDLTTAEFNADDKQNPVANDSISLDSLTDSRANSASFGYTLNTEHGEFKTGLAYRNNKGFSFAGYTRPNNFEQEDMTFKAQYTHNFVSTQGAALANLTGGIDVIHGTNETVSFNEEAMLTLRDDEEVDLFVYAPYAQLEVFPMDKTKVTLGLRYEEIEYDVKDNLDSSNDATRKFSQLSPKLGMTYEVTDDHMFFAGFSQGFAPPSDGALLSEDGTDLAAERSKNYEIGMRGDFAQQNVSYDVGLYYLNISDWIVNESLGRGAFRAVNAGKVNFRGLEAAVKYAPVDWLSFASSYTYSRNKFQDFVDRGTDNSGNILSSSPRHHLNLRMTVTPVDKLSVELEMDAYSDYYTNNDNDLDPEGEYQQDGIYNLRANYDAGPVELWFNVLNLTDKKYATRVSYDSRGAEREISPGDGRTIYLGAAYNF